MRDHQPNYPRLLMRATRSPCWCSCMCSTSDQQILSILAERIKADLGLSDA